MFGTKEISAQELKKFYNQNSNNFTSGTKEISAQELKKFKTTKTDNTKTDNTKTDITKTDTVVGGNFRYNSKTPSIGQVLKDNNINNKVNNKKLLDYLNVDKMEKDMLTGYRPRKKKGYNLLACS